MKIYKIDDSKFRGIYLSLNFSMQSNKNVLSQNSVLSSMMFKKTKKYGAQKEVEKYMASLYGSNFNVNVEKYGDIQNVEFKIECVNPEILKIDDDIVKKCIEFLHNVTFDTNINEKDFDDSLFKREKEFILEKINARKDEKLKYGVNRTEEIISDGSSFGTFLYGDYDIVQKLEKKDMIKAYDRLMSQSVITFVISGNLKNYENIDDFILKIFKNKDIGTEFKDLKYNQQNTINNLEEVSEKCESAQSVMTAGIKIKDVKKEDIYAINVYNAILGSTPSSKLFQIFREKESLAYTARSRYYSFKDIIIIYAGIENKNYQKGKEVITNILEDLKKGNITEEEFNAAKQSLIADLKEWKDSKIMMEKFLFSELVKYGEITKTVEEMEARISSVTMQDVIDISKKLELKVWYLLGGEKSE